MKRSLLILDDDHVFCSLLVRHFEQEYGVVGFSDPEKAVSYLGANRVDVVLTDLNMPKMNGLEVLQIVRMEAPDTDVILMTAYAEVETAIEAMKRGAYDYIVKPFQIDELTLHLEKLFEKRSLSEENAELRNFIDLSYKPEKIVGNSQAINQIRRFIERVSQTDFTILVSGESGTGKDIVAKSIHFAGKRKDKKIMFLHCAALPEKLLETELFGAETIPPGPGDGKKGLLESAEGGTVVLEGIECMGLELQTKLATVLERRSVRRTGGSREIPFGTMVIATTDADLPRLSENGQFRKDLFYRLDMFSLRIPPLRERGEDIRVLAEHFFERYRSEFGHGEMKLSGGVFDLLERYDWPGNVRELKGLMAKICLLEEELTITPAHILSRITLPDHPASDIRSSGNVPLFEMEQNLIRESLRKSGGNVMKAAKLLNISYYTLRYRMKKFGITADDPIGAPE